MWIIEQIEVLPLKAPLIQPFRTALGDHETLENLLFILTLASGVRGYGEAAIATHITGETFKETLNHLQAAAQWLTGKDVRNYLLISNVLHERWPENPAMIAAVETALLDAMTRQLKCPLWKWFGPRCRKLRTDITIVIADLAETEETTRRFYRQGFRQFKVKIGRDMDLDLRRVEAVAKLAPKGAVYIDANQGFSAGQTLKFLQALKRRGIRPALIEQPVPRDDREGLKKITRSTDIPVCADESARTLSEAISIIKEKAATVINIKLMKFGMIHAVEIARVAQAANVPLMIGGMMESSLAMTASAHLAAGLGCFTYIDLDTPFFIRDEVARHPYLSQKGVYSLQDVHCGIGIIPRGIGKFESK